MVATVAAFYDYLFSSKDPASHAVTTALLLSDKENAVLSKGLSKHIEGIDNALKIFSETLIHNLGFADAAAAATPLLSTPNPLITKAAAKITTKEAKYASEYLDKLSFRILGLFRATCDGAAPAAKRAQKPNLDDRLPDELKTLKADLEDLTKDLAIPVDQAARHVFVLALDGQMNAINAKAAKLFKDTQTAAVKIRDTNNTRKDVLEALRAARMVGQPVSIRDAKKIADRANLDTTVLNDFFKSIPGKLQDAVAPDSPHYLPFREAIGDKKMKSFANFFGKHSDTCKKWLQLMTKEHLMQKKKLGVIPWLGDPLPPAEEKTLRDLLAGDNLQETLKKIGDDRVIELLCADPAIFLETVNGKELEEFIVEIAKSKTTAGGALSTEFLWQLISHSSDPTETRKTLKAAQKTLADASPSIDIWMPWRGPLTVDVQNMGIRALKGAGWGVMGGAAWSAVGGTAMSGSLCGSSLLTGTAVGGFLCGSGPLLTGAVIGAAGLGVCAGPILAAGAIGIRAASSLYRGWRNKPSIDKAAPPPAIDASLFKREVSQLPSLADVLKGAGVTEDTKNAAEGLRALFSPAQKVIEYLDKARSLYFKPEHHELVLPYVASVCGGGETLAEASSIMGNAEALLNLVGHVPFICYWSGLVRVSLGVVTIIASVGFGVWTTLKSKQEKASLLGRTIIIEGAEQGLANVTRGLIETSWIFSALLLLPLDLSGYRLAYSGEKASPLHLTRVIEWINKPKEGIA